MKETLTQAGTNTDKQKEIAPWYRALSLTERAAFTPPPWLTELLAAFTDQHFGEDFTLPLTNQDFDPQHLAFLTLIKPLLARGTQKLQSEIQELIQTYTQLPFDPDTIMPLIFTPLIKQLLTKLLRTAVLELNVARVQERLHGDTPEARFQDFMQQITQPAGIPSLLEEYVVLARQLVETIDNWITRELELLTRLCQDWEQIRTTFTPDNDPGLLVGFDEGAGDTHCGGRSVTILTWRSGFRLVYKPRSLAIDCHFQDLLAWLNTQGQRPPFRTFTILNKGTYGWVEFLYTRTCTSKGELERFYQRQGSYLALLYALEATDFHAENLIAVGEHPMLVDLESLFQPRVSVSVKDKLEFSSFETTGRSVLRVNLLPQRFWSEGDNEGVDMSGLGGQAGQLNPIPIPYWTEMGTDQMRLTRKRVELTMSHNRPTLNGKDINALEYCNNIVAGFDKTYRLLIQCRQELLTQFLPRFTHDTTRCLLRPTGTYSILSINSFHPNVLRDALDRDRLFDRLWMDIELKPYLSRVIAAEQADLRNGDIPMFTCRLDERDLFTSDGKRITEFFEESGIERVTKHIQQLDEEDLERQTWVIRASFACATPITDKMTRKTLQLRPSKTTPTRERLLAAAQTVGNRLSKLAFANKETVGWLGIDTAKEREWNLLAAGEDLYNGTAGIVLFLAYLGMLTGEERYTALARSALPALRHRITQKKRDPLSGAIGTFMGLGSFIYLLSHLGAIWNEAALHDEAEEIVKLLPGAIVREKNFDVIGGSAGCIASLLSLYQVAPSETTLTTAGLCGDHLLACAEAMEHGIGWKSKSGAPPLIGFAHGNAGIALNLLRLFEISEEERFRRGALAAIEHERSLFSPQQQNWPDLRIDSSVDKENNTQFPAEQAQKYMTAWCHGAPGIGLARLGSLKVLDDPAIREEIDAAIQTTLKSGFGMNHSLCHGDMGNLDLLLLATQLLDKPEYQKQVDNISAMLLDSIDRQGWVTGVPLSVETPGLMVGLAGIGYELLRLAASGKVPSVLLGEPPRQSV